MNREIKFKAKRIDQEGSQEQVFTLQDIANLRGLFPAYGNWRQFTGLLDKNGKEVYEGDVVEFDKTEWGGNDNIHIVSWDEKDAAWCFGGGGASSDMEWRTVIGNIDENPELISS